MRGKGILVPDSELDNTKYKLTLIAKKAEAEPKLKFTSQMHLLDEQYLMKCFKVLKANKAPGVDRRTVESYSKDEIKAAVSQLVEDLKTQKYRPQPVRRVFIPKANGKQRPLGIPVVMDRILQRAVANILEPLYEPLFRDCSYGFRPGRSAHDALKAVNHMVMGQKVNWIIDADIKDFFGNVNHTWLMECLKQRINEPNLLRLIQRFLKAGVMEGGTWERTLKGTPQGGIVSPILANIYLHYVLDLWFELKEAPQQSGHAQLVRYADDFVIGAQHKHEAYAMLEDIRQRLAKFGLELSEEKTHILEFGRYAARNRGNRGQGKPESFDFLGFRHYCSTTRDGRFSLKVETSRKKFAAAVLSQKLWFKRVRTQPIKRIWRTLASKLQGHYNYYGVSGNFAAVKYYYRQNRALAFKWLNRRSQKRSWNWEEFQVYLDTHPLPQPKVNYAIYNTW
jgi:group II intron reverse transcriptase/maturase